MSKERNGQQRKQQPKMRMLQYKCYPNGRKR